MCITKTTWKEKEIDASNAPVNVHMWSIYLCLRFHQSLHTHKEESSLSDSKSAAIPPQLKRVKNKLKREMVKKDSGKRCPSLLTSLSTHLWSFSFKRIVFFLLYEILGRREFVRTMKLTCLTVGFFFWKKKYLWIDQNRGTSFDLTLSFQIIWCTSLAPFDEQQRTFEERERERTVLCWEIYKNI